MSLEELRQEVEYVYKTNNPPRIKGFGMKNLPIQKVLDEESS